MKTLSHVGWRKWVRFSFFVILALLAIQVAYSADTASPAPEKKPETPKPQPARGVTKLSADLRVALENPEGFKLIKTVAELPAPVVALNEAMADPGQKWQATDVVIVAGLPWRRLIWAANKADVYVVVYERGGIAHGYNIMVATYKNGDKTAKAAWRAVISGTISNVTNLAESLKKNDGRLDDSLDYGY